ncbi:MAG: endonuclease III [Proteobacteria bacterium SG_bin7]|nr:MAG: endonuclease III [Proteobacteria bacterium SG_bin7]
MARVNYVISLLKKYYPDAKCSLDFKNPFELLVATVLSAQCTDERVNKVTPALFKKYPDARAMAKAQISDLEELIRSTGFYKNKAKNLKNTAEILMSSHGGVIPRSLDELTHLSGVGKKTANVVLGTAYGIASGVVVDTHVGRLSQRLGLTKNKTPEKIQQDLEKVIPQENWIEWSHLLIYHGRQICKARKPQCEVCFLQEICPKTGVAR